MPDLLAGVDARNISNLMRDNNLTISQAYDQYYNHGGSDSRFTDFIDSYGGLSGLEDAIRDSFSGMANFAFETNPTQEEMDVLVNALLEKLKKEAEEEQSKHDNNNENQNDIIYDDDSDDDNSYDWSDYDPLDSSENWWD